MDNLEGIFNEITVFWDLEEESYYLDKAKAIIKTKNVSNLFDLGKRYMEEEHYLGAKVIFERVYSENLDIKISDLYKKIAVSLATIKSKVIEKDKSYYSSRILKDLIYCMAESANMFSKNEISEEELFNVEKMIDRVPFGELKIKDITEFERIYSKFKEYVIIDVFVGGNKEDDK